jgi:hypothetical protein
MVKKIAAAFRAPEGDDEMESLSLPHSGSMEPEPVQTSVPGGLPEPASTLKASSPPVYRQGKKNLSVWIDAKAFAQFKSIVALEGETLQDYVIKMLNEEFARKNRPQIAK